MIVKNSMIVFFSLLIGGIINFSSISIFSRLLNPSEYGLYALALSAALISKAFIFQWILQSFSRFASQKTDDLSKVYFLNFALLLLKTSCLFFAMVLSLYFINQWSGDFLKNIPKMMWVIVPLIAITESFYNLFSHYIRVVHNRIWIFAAATILRSTLYIVLGYYLIAMGYSYMGLLIAILLSFVISFLLLILSEKDTRQFSKKDIKKNIASEAAAFGLPIIIVMGIQVAISSTDNFLLTLFIDVNATGQYAVAVDLVTKTLIFLMLIINKTTYPLTVQCLEKEGVEAAKIQYQNNSILLFSLSIPACLGIAMLSYPIANILLGSDFREVSAQIIPYVVVIALLNCVYMFYLAPAFQLAKKTKMMIIPVVAALIINAIVSSLFIPFYEIYGAIIGSFSAYLTCVVISAFLVRKVFPIALPVKDILKIIVSSILMGVGILPFMNSFEISDLVIAVILGGCIYAISYLIFNVGGYRSLIYSQIKRAINKS